MNVQNITSSVFSCDDDFVDLHIKCRCADVKARQTLANLALKDSFAKGYYAAALHADETLREKMMDKIESLANEIYPHLTELVTSETSDSNAHFLLGFFNYHGLSCQEDICKAAQHFRAAAAHSHILALCNLGTCYYKGWSNQEADMNEAFRHYKLSADLGNPVAQYNAGLCLELGIGVDADVSHAVRYFRMAADRGYPEAQYSLGVCLETGSAAGNVATTPKDMEEAFKYYSLAAESGHTTARHAVGVCLENGEGVSKNTDLAAAAFLIAADAGYPASQCCVGQRFEYGNGLNKDLRKAVNYYILAAENGHSEAQFMAGWSLEFGQGTEFDIPRAVDFYQRAADNGLPLAQCNFARCCEFGIGVGTDLARAVSYYKLAAAEEMSEDPVTAAVGRRAKRELCRLISTQSQSTG
jgi:uncharacterized protein